MAIPAISKQDLADLQLLIQDEQKYQTINSSPEPLQELAKALEERYPQLIKRVGQIEDAHMLKEFQFACDRLAQAHTNSSLYHLLIKLSDYAEEKHDKMFTGSPSSR